MTAYTHSFSGVYPPPRYDDLPWTTVLVEQSAGSEGIWSQIATAAVPEDLSPQFPTAFNLTVTTATLAEGYFRWRFVGAGGERSPYGGVVRSPYSGPPPEQLPGGVTLERFKAILEVKKSEKDEMLLGYLQDAAGFAAAFTRRQLLCLQDDATAPVTITVPLNGGQWARVPDARDISAVMVDDELVTTSVGYTQPVTEPGSPIALLRLPAVGETLLLTARFGFLTLPASLAGAIYAHAGRNYRERQAQFADTVDLSGGDGTGALYSYFRQLPPRVQAAYALWRLDSDWISV